MIPPELISQIRNDPFLNYLINPVLRFDNYLNSTSRMHIRIKGIKLRYANDDSNLEIEDIQSLELDLGYPHRWTERYDHHTLWKLYHLQYYYIAHPDRMPKYTMMITLTGSHASPKNPTKQGLSHMAYLDKFHESHRREKKMVGKYLNTVDYLSILEGHPESGYIHAHDLYFLDNRPSKETLALIQNHWNNTLGMGSAEHGIKIEIKEPKDFHDIKSLVAYPMAYIGKTTIGDLPEWTKYDLIFNTCLWLSGQPKIHGGLGKRIRAFQPSRSLSAIMNPTIDNSNFKYVETTLKTENDNRVLHQCPDYDNNIELWMDGGGDNGQCDTLDNLMWQKKIENISY